MKIENKSTLNQIYWEKNIEGFSGFYDTQSEEHIIGNKFFTWLYKMVLFPVEKKYMFERHKHVSNYIKDNVKAGMIVADIGCGSGVYVLKMIDQNASKVYALDYAKSAIELSKRNLKDSDQNKIHYKVFDVTKESIAKTDVAISIGVLPYIDDIETYLNNILPYTDAFFFNYLDSNNLLNKLRIKLGFLDVRKYSYHNFEEIFKLPIVQDFTLVKKVRLASGWMIELKRKK